MALTPKKPVMITPASKFKKLPARYMAVIMPLILSGMMSAIVSLISTLKSLGLQPDLLGIWLGTWVISWIVAFPTVLVVLPVARRFTLLFVQSPQP
jgi:hypothetical protein